MKKHNAVAILVLVTIIWGGGFIAVKLSLDAGLGAGALNMIRGAFYSVLVLVFFGRQVFAMTKEQFINGLAVGVFNFLGFIFQSMGAIYTTPSNSAFLTVTNVVMVPFFAFFMYRVKPRWQNMLAVALCVPGMGILTGFFSEKIAFNIGDFYTVLGAAFFGISIVLLSRQPRQSHFAPGAFLLGFTMFIGGLFYAVFFGEINIFTRDWKMALIPVIYLGVLSSFAAQTMQIAAQKHLSAVTASLVMMLEGVFGSLFSVIAGFEPFTVSLLVGGAMIISSLVLSEVEFKKKEGRPQGQNV